MNEFKIGNSYIIKYTGVISRVTKGKVTDLTETSVKIRWEDKTEVRYELPKFFNYHYILEDLGDEFFKSIHYCYEKI